MRTIFQRMTGSRAYAWCLALMGFILAILFIHKGAYGEATSVAIALAGLGAGLYGSKQVQERKEKEVGLTKFNQKHLDREG